MIRMLVGNQNGIEALGVLTDSSHPLVDHPTAQTTINKQPDFTGPNKCGIAAAAAAENRNTYGHCLKRRLRAPRTSWAARKLKPGAERPLPWAEYPHTRGQVGGTFVIFSSQWQVSVQ